MRCQLLLFCAAVLALRAEVERVEINFDHVRAKAEALAQESYRKPNARLPAKLEELSYDQYRSIRFNPSEALWRDEDLPFQLQFLPRGGLFRDPVALYEFSPTHAQDIPYLERFFDFSALGDDVGSGRVGYAGFRVHYPLSRPDSQDEVMVFLGASYFRAVAAEMAFGISARGIAIDSGRRRVREEFPCFTTFWIGKPEPGDTSLRFYALLDGPRVAGAYEFAVAPGKATLVDVRIALWFREAVEEPGWAPLTSMFWYGENTNRPRGEPRPEVHDSDGLLIQTTDGGTLWRPLHDPSSLFVTEFPTSGLKRFGLLQRDRDFASYEDPEAEYHRRPSAWVEPKGEWGAGLVRLIELPAEKEYADNIGAFWRPDAPIVAGQPVEFSYRLVFGVEPPAEAPARVVATRQGTLPDVERGRLFWIDFSGETLKDLSPENAGAEIEPSAGVEVLHHTIKRLPQGRGWRVMVQVSSSPETKRAELRCTLRNGYDPVSETWTFAWQP